MAEESALQLPPLTAPEAEGPKDVSPETATPKPPFFSYSLSGNRGTCRRHQEKN